MLLVLSGSVSVLQENIGFPGSKNPTGSEVHSYNSYSGDMIGGLSVLTAETCQYTVRARHHTKVAILSKTSVYKYVFATAQLPIMNVHDFFVLFFCSIAV